MSEVDKPKPIEVMHEHAPHILGWLLKKKGLKFIAAELESLSGVTIDRGNLSRFIKKNLLSKNSGQQEQEKQMRERLQELQATNRIADDVLGGLTTQTSQPAAIRIAPAGQVGGGASKPAAHLKQLLHQTASSERQKQLEEELHLNAEEICSKRDLI